MNQDLNSILGILLPSRIKAKPVQVYTLGNSKEGQSRFPRRSCSQALVEIGTCGLIVGIYIVNYYSSVTTEGPYKTKYHIRGSTAKKFFRLDNLPYSHQNYIHFVGRLL